MKGERRQVFFGIVGGLLIFFITLIFEMPLPLIMILPALSYIGTYEATKPQIKIGDISLSQANGQEMKELMEEGAKDIRDLEMASKKIEDQEIRDLAKGLYDRGLAIYSHLQENPDKIKKARRFLSYYLDMASALLTKYQSLVKSQVQGDSVEKAEQDVKTGLKLLLDAFDEEFERLMQGEIMDINSDVKVLETTLRRID